MIQLKCTACDFVYDVDMRDKLITFIVKNSPEAKKGSKHKKDMRRAKKERMKEGEMQEENIVEEKTRNPSMPKAAEEEKEDAVMDNEIEVEDEQGIQERKKKKGNRRGNGGECGSRERGLRWSVTWKEGSVMFVLLWVVAAATFLSLFLWVSIGSEEKKKNSYIK
ncbi:Eukaryotic translation initiation factor 5A-1 [Stylosanthes scabra]|uniref:Eukaryotic translation initiation factor 5A-1 n=1 Tax=Stylosanthes scabra TaxID=79078 RepID=A0ABU6VPZ8_9FABA|nr:Eukaryotic translation initiation factor 5A-1 [Stylosanthes scabra]